MGSLSAMEDLRVGDVRTPPTDPGSVREAELVRGPAYGGMLSPAVPAFGLWTLELLLSARSALCRSGAVSANCT